MSADDPRYLRWLTQNRVVITAALVISIGISLYVCVRVPWNATITLHERNSGNAFGLPLFAILIWPAAYVGMLCVALREKPKPIPYWEYKLGRWIIYIVLAAFMAGLVIWSLEFLAA